MHIPDGYLSPQTYAPLYGLMLFVWQRASVKVKETISKKNLPLLALATAFAFVIQMFNIPIPGGSTGHAVGSAVIAITLGPWAAVIAVSAVLVLQALLFGDGGITAIAANSLTMAVITPFAAYCVFHLLAGKYRQFGLRQKISAAVAGYISVNLGAIATAILLGIQPIIAVSATGEPLYAPYPLKVALPAIALQHLLFFGFLEAVVTGVVCAYLARTDVLQYKKPRRAFGQRSLDEV